MNLRKKLPLSLVLLGLFVFQTLAGAEAELPGAPDDGAKKEEKRENGKLGYPQIRTSLMDFADRYAQMVGQAADTLKRQNDDPSARVGIHSTKLFPVAAAGIFWLRKK